MNNNQLELVGIGQQKMTLEQWKKDNNIFTHRHYVPTEDEKLWSCWDELESPHDFIDKYGQQAIAMSMTEKQAILDFCFDNEIEIPFWW